MLELERVGVRYGEVVALDRVDTAINRGEVLALLGANGAGKSTLFDLLLGLVRPTDGIVRVFGRAPGGGMRPRVGAMLQNAGLPGQVSVAELPSWSFLAAKVGVALVGGLLIVASVGGLAVAAGNARLDAGTWLALTLTVLAGVLAFSTLGFAIAYAVRPRAATAIANLIFLPLAFLSGFFVPLGELPSVLSDIAAWLPTHHFGHLAWQLVAPATDVEAWTGVASAATAVHLAWVLGATAVFGAIAALASSRAGITRHG